MELNPIDHKERKKQRDHLSAKELLIAYVVFFAIVFVIHLLVFLILLDEKMTVNTLALIFLWDLIIAFVILLLFTGSIEVLFILSNM